VLQRGGQEVPHAGKGDDVRARLVAAAARVLEREGPAAVQARRLTRDIGTSTTAVYHYFGGMPELLRAVADDGFAHLEHRLGGVDPSGDPVTDICVLALVYRRAARENPHLYYLMFGLAAPGGHRPEPTATAGDTEGPAHDAYAHLVAAVRRGIDQRRLREVDAVHAAAQLWSMLHGFVTLELAGHFDHIDDPIAHVLLPLGTHLLIGLGDDPDRALNSGAAAMSTMSAMSPSSRALRSPR
jgi:AcrR family transcriptional regulator